MPAGDIAGTLCDIHTMPPLGEDTCLFDATT